MVSALAITNGRVVTPEGLIDGGVLVREGRIAAIGSFATPADAETVDAKGKLIAPGLIDVGVRTDFGDEVDHRLSGNPWPGPPWWPG